MPQNQNTTRLNKFLSEHGVASRRGADAIISAGRVTVNGKRATLGTQVGPDDDVRVDKRPIQHRELPVYLAYHKPVGVICTTDRSKRDNILDAIDFPTRIFPIGRLDVASEGLILLTNDGDVVNKILRSKNRHEKEYEVAVDKPITNQFLQRLRTGVPILNTVTKKCKVEKISDYQFKIILTQGLNRQIRRMCEACGYSVKKLRRVRIMHITLKGLSINKWRELTGKEVDELHRLLGRAEGISRG